MSYVGEKRQGEGKMRPVLYVGDGKVCHWALVNEGCVLCCTLVKKRYTVLYVGEGKVCPVLYTIVKKGKVKERCVLCCTLVKERCVLCCTFLMEKRILC